MRIGQTSAIHFISRLAGSVISFLAIVYFSRKLGPAVLGTYFLVLAIVNWVKNLSTAGVATSVTKRMSEGNSNPSAYLTAGLTVQAVIFSILGGGVILFSDYLNDFVGGNVALFVVGLIGVQSVFSLIGAGLQGQRKVHIFAMLDPARQILAGGSQIIFVFIGMGLTGLLFGKIAGVAVTVFVGTIFLSYKYTRPTQKRISNVVSYAKYAWVEGIRMQTFVYLDTLVLAFFVSREFIGFYQIAFNISAILALFGVSISQTLFPEMSRADSVGESDQIANLLNDALAFSGLLLIPGAIGSVFVGRAVLRIYGSEFVAADTILIVLILSQISFVYMSQFLNVLNAIDRPDLTFRLNIIFALTNLALNAILIVAIGWIGAAVASLSSSLVGVILSYRAAGKYIEITFPVKELSYQILSACLMGGSLSIILFFGFESIVPGPPLVEDLSLIVFGALIYMSTLSYLSLRIRSIIRENIPKYTS